ncbi:MAG: ribbon-helix-helix protein, CopG family [Candidatus Lokiarchaeota archaeon]
MKLISVNLPETYLEILEILVADGKFPNRSEAIRVSIRDLIKTEYLLEETLKRTHPEEMEASELETELQEKIIV